MSITKFNTMDLGTYETDVVVSSINQSSTANNKPMIKITLSDGEDSITALGMIRPRQDSCRQYGVVILDWKMPGMDGMETVRRIRSEIDERIEEPTYRSEEDSITRFDKAKRRKRNNRNNVPQKVRVAKTNNHQGGNPGAKGKRRATSTLPTRNARLYVGNLSYEATESELEDLFKGFGNVRSVEIIYNPRTYKSKGYAFVEMQLLEDAQRAAEVLHGQPFMGRELMVSAAIQEIQEGDELVYSFACTWDF